MSATISISFKLEGEGAISTFKELIGSSDSLKKALNSAAVEATKVKKNIINVATVSTVVNNLTTSINALKGVFAGLTADYSNQIEAETKLATAMRNTMNATSAEIQSIKDLCAAQQELGVIGDEVQLAGAQKLATYLTEKENLEKLIPVMNDMVAQQYGLNASQESAAQVGSMLGKVMNGQTGALSRYGYTFDEVQKRILEYGTEAERAAVLSDVVSRSVGGMNQSLAQTPVGRFKQIANEMGDLREKLGAITAKAMPFIEWSAAALISINSFVQLAMTMKALSLKAKTLAVTSGTLKTSLTTLAGIVKSLKTAWMALNAVFSASPIGAIVLALGMVVAILGYAYSQSETFRNACDKLWQSIKPLAEAIMKGLVKAFEWVCEKAKIAFDWLCKILGLSGEKVEVEVDVKKKPEDEAYLDELMKKYANFTPPSAATKRTEIKTSQEPIYNANANTIKGYDDNIAALTRRREVEESEAVIIQINKEIEMWKALKEAKETAGLVQVSARVQITDVDESADTIQRVQSNLDTLNKLFETANESQRRLLNPQIDKWTKRMEEMRNAGSKALEIDENASTLRGYLDNVKILREALMDATDDEQEAIKRSIAAWKAKADAVEETAEKQEKSTDKIASAVSAAGAAFRGMGDAFEMPALDAMGIMAGAIATMIQSFATALAQSKGPWEWIAFGATGLATLMTMISQVKSAGAFATGGIIGGNSPSGDKLFARVNSGEMILNKSQQSKLFSMINRGVSLPSYIPPEISLNRANIPTLQPVVVTGRIRIAGRDIDIALSNEKRAGMKIGRSRV